MSRVVAGHCPMGCGQTLILLPDTRVWCGSRTCQKPEAVSALLAAQPVITGVALSREYAVCIEDEGQLHQISAGTYPSPEAARFDEQAVLSLAVIGTAWRTPWQPVSGDDR